MTPGTQIGRYSVLRHLATGGMGEVYLAESTGAANFKKQVIIKRILPHLAQNPDFVHKFIDEAQIMVQLHHGNIASVIELAEEDGNLFLVTEYLPGRDLKAAIRASRSHDTQMGSDLALEIVRQVCAGLEYAHRKKGTNGEPLGIVHRDVSPSNILLGAGGTVKLIDFGIARARGRLHQSVSGTLQGKFIYMSPEQGDGHTVDQRSDIFAAGLVLYELLTGKRPFEGQSETETLRLVRRGLVPPLIDLRPEADDALSELVMKALATNPEDRYQTAGDMVIAINRYLALRDSQVGPGRLAKFLESIFPEGVVPSTAPSPKSLDDALLMQLNALTPSLGLKTDTRTRTGSFSTGLSTSSATNSGDPSLRVDTASVIVEPKASGRKRLVFLGVMLGLLCSALGFTLLPNDTSARLSMEVSPASATVTLDGAPFNASEPLTRGRTYVVCASATDHSRRCERIQLDAASQALKLELTPYPVLTPRIEPAGVNYRVMLDRADVTELLPLRIKPNQVHTVCVEAEGYETAKCARVKASEGSISPEFTLNRQTAPPSQAPPESRPDQPRNNRSDAEASKATRVKRSTTVLIESIPTAEVWRNGRQLGVTPHRQNTSKGRVRLILKAKGYADTPVETKGGQTGPVRVALARPAHLTLRVYPPATEIWINAKRASTGYLDRFAIAPGKHQLELRYYQGGQVIHRVSRSIQLGPGENRRMGTIRLLDQPGTGQEDQSD